MTMEEQIQTVKDLSGLVYDARAALSKKRKEMDVTRNQETHLFNELSRAEFNLKVEQEKLLRMVEEAK